MFLTDRKLERRITELEKYRYRDIIALNEFAVQEDTQGVVNPVLPTSFEGWDTLRVQDTWKGRDLYLWMHKDIEIPSQWKGRKVVGVFDYGNTGAGNNAGFESMVYLNGEMYQAVDANHKEVFFNDALCGTTADVTFRLWSGLEGGGVPTAQEHRIARADLAWLDEKTDDFYYMASMVWQTIRELDEFDPIQHELRKALDGACHLIDWSYPGSEEFYESVYQADEFLNEKIDGMHKDSMINIRCVGHTHIDMAWLWRLKHTKEKGSRSFSTVLRLMEMYPEYIFLQTQPQIYEYMKEEFPKIYAKIKEKVKEGRWEVDGAMWVEADCNLTSGESLTRQILIGSKFIKDEFGKDVKYLWLPDVFGYSWALPQILKKAGIDTFMTTKISWNQYNRMPHDTFKWKGIDGSEVLTHFITAPEPWNEPGSWFYTYNGKLLPKTVKGTWDAYSEKQMNKELLIAYGFGDGGGGVNRDMLEYRRRIDRIPGLPHLKTSTAAEYFRNLQETVKNTDQYVHTWDGELYLEYHRGTYTSQGYNKRMNRKMELLYRRTEWLTVMEALQEGSLERARQEELTKGWKHILTDQFHDIIPGSSIHEVYEDSRKDYEYIECIAKEVEEKAYKAVLEAKENAYTVFNASAWRLDQNVEILNDVPGIYKDEEGNILTSQTEEGVTYVEVKDVPQMGAKVIYFEPLEAELADPVFEVNGKDIDTPFYHIALNNYGQITRLYDKTFERDVLPEGERANVLQMFEDKPIDNDAWDIDIFYQQKMREITELTAFEVTQMGALQMTIHMEWKYMSSLIRQDLVLYSNNRRIDFRTNVDYHERQQLLKAAFPVDVRSTYGTFDVQYGNVRRPNHWNTSWDQARFETVAHRWADLSERNYGVSILNDCKYGHDIKDNVMRITLLKSGLQPDHLQDQGMHAFTYSLLPHGGDFVEGNVVQEAFALNEPMQAVKGKSTLAYESFLTFDNEQVELDAVKKSEDGRYIVIRFHEFAGSRQNVTMKTGFDFKAWAESDLRERPISTFSEKKEITMELHAYEIKTLLIEL
ncbi:alpha-mannosidase [Roseburia hominis]